MMVLHLLDLGKAEMNSMVTLFHGLDASGRGSDDPVGSWWSNLCCWWSNLSCWHTRQVCIYASMSSHMCGKKQEP